MPGQLKRYDEDCKGQIVYGPRPWLVAPFNVMSRGKQPKSSELRGLIARRLKAAREAYEPNASQVARDLGVTPQVLNAYEKGRNYPDETFLVRFFNLTSCPADWIFQGRMQSEMSPVMAARIGVAYPDLIPEPPPAMGRAEASALAASGKSAAALGRAKARKLRV